MVHAGRALRIAAGAGRTFAANLFEPEPKEEPAPSPAVLIVPEMYGVNEYINSVAALYAEHGYLTLVMDVLWRVEPELVLSYVGEDTVRAHAIHDAFDFEAGVADVQAAINRLREMPACNGRVGVVGFCLGGTMAYVAALRTDGDAFVDYYGSRAVEFAAEAATRTTPLLLHTGSADTAFPPGGRERLEAASAKNPQFTSYVYAGAKHAFANDVRADRYDAEAAHLALRRTFRFVDEQLH